MIHIHSKQNLVLGLISISFIYFASGFDASGPAEALDVGNGVGRKKRESCENVTSRPSIRALSQSDVRAERLLNKAHTWSKRPAHENRS